MMNKETCRFSQIQPEPLGFTPRCSSTNCRNMPPNSVLALGSEGGWALLSAPSSLSAHLASPQQHLMRKSRKLPRTAWYGPLALRSG
jgi:hypothetical protein